jgi:hypothetical protein
LAALEDIHLDFAILGSIDSWVILAVADQGLQLDLHPLDNLLDDGRLVSLFHKYLSALAI